MKDRDYLLEQFHIQPTTLRFVEEAEEEIKAQMNLHQEIGRYNAYKVLHAFLAAGVANRHFVGTTGYGYSDDGRSKLGEVFSHIFGAEAALVSPLISSGTHALSIALFGLLRPLDTMLSVTGRPYDTLTEVIGMDGATGGGSLADFAVKYQEIPLTTGGQVDLTRVLDALHLNPSIKMVYLQRSRGYAWRPTLCIEEIERVTKKVKEKYPDVWVVVDNCYGEFTEMREPTEVGVDLAVGSLIKNPGGGLAPTGAYFAGTQEAIDLVAQRLTCAGLGQEVGSYLAGYLPYFQGVYLAPKIVENAMMGAVLTARVFEKLGFQVFPSWDAARGDITQAVRLHSAEQLIALVQAVQAFSPVDSNAVPYPWDMPGYQDPVIMAAGAFIQGGSIELSADGPVREPYIAYMQGGLTYEQVKLALMGAIDKMQISTSGETGVQLV